MNRRKPKVVIPRNVDELMFAAQRVFDLITAGDSVVQGNPSLAAPLASLEASITAANGFSSILTLASEESQMALAARNESFDTLRDVLIQIRDYAVARGGGQRSAAGLCGFEVVQSTSSSGVARVVIPGNPEQFIALAKRVNECVLAGDDAEMKVVAVPMPDLITSATDLNNEALMKREKWQLYVSQRRSVLNDMTLALRQLRDLAFAVVGPRNYESVSSLGFIVQSDATQNASFGPSGSGPAPDAPVPPVTKSLSDLWAQVDSGGSTQQDAIDDGLFEGTDLTFASEVTEEFWLDFSVNTLAGFVDTDTLEGFQAAWDAA